MLVFLRVGLEHVPPPALAFQGNITRLGQESISKACLEVLGGSVC